MSFYRVTAALLFAGILLTGCSNSKDQPPTQRTENTKPDEVAVERALLSAEDRALVEAQEWCVINADERLGSMGAPLKLDIKGKPVFVCCKGCKKKAEADPDKTLAKVEELKAKAIAEKETKK